MIKTEEIPATKTMHSIYCDDCGKFITSSIECDDGYYSNPAEFRCCILSYKLEKDLCAECQNKYYTKIKEALIKIGFR